MSNETVDQDLLTKWAELKGLLEELESDVSKSAKGVKAASVRVRRGLRTLKAKASDVVKYSVSKDKSEKTAK
jgi:hypothetical protein